jgi:CrcB protein
MIRYVLVFLGGGLGAAARYGLQGIVYRFVPSTFPYGTLVANVTGCFLIGLLMTMFDDRFLIQPSLRIFLAIGLLGGFTTFSSFSFETIALLRDSEFLLGSLNVLISLAGCLLGTYIGLIVGKII